MNIWKKKIFYIAILLISVDLVASLSYYRPDLYNQTAQEHVAALKERDGYNDYSVAEKKIFDENAEKVSSLIKRGMELEDFLPTLHEKILKEFTDQLRTTKDDLTLHEVSIRNFTTSTKKQLKLHDLVREAFVKYKNGDFSVTKQEEKFVHASYFVQAYSHYTNQFEAIKSMVLKGSGNMLDVSSFKGYEKLIRPSNQHDVDDNLQGMSQLINDDFRSSNSSNQNVAPLIPKLDFSKLNKKEPNVSSFVPDNTDLGLGLELRSNNFGRDSVVTKAPVENDFSTDGALRSSRYVGSQQMFSREEGIVRTARSYLNKEAQKTGRKPIFNERV